jgi:cytidylate kinase
MIIAIDGPAAAGKGTLAKRLAEHFDLAYLDTGLIYRAVAAKVLAAGGPVDEAAVLDAAESLRITDLETPGLRGEAVSERASQVAAMPTLRDAVLGIQRRFAHSPPIGRRGAVLDGRDIGTVVCPEADVKLFVTASIEERTARRHKELLARGEASIYAQILQDMEKRDARDSGRATAPLKPAQDALVLDTTNLDPDAVFKAALILISKQNRAAGEE